MMTFLFIIVMISSAFASDFDHWPNAANISERHEFYKDNQVIDVPKDTNQILFAVEYGDGQNIFKDCLIYKVPGNELGVLKLKKIRKNDKCKDYLFQKGDKEWIDLKSLQYSLADNFISLHLTQKNYEIIKFDVPLLPKFKKKDPRMNISSAQYKGPKVIFNFVEESLPKLKDGVICQKVKEDCSLDGSSTCESCEAGWHEIPNGCAVGPKYCGYITCGQKNRPACRRGIKFQHKNKKFHCTEDSSFAFCAKGLQIQCQGNLAYCI